MPLQTHLLDLPNEIWIDHILPFIPQQNLFWTVGLTCQRLMSLTFDICNQVILSPESFNGKEGIAAEGTSYSEVKRKKLMIPKVQHTSNCPRTSRCDSEQTKYMLQEKFKSVFMYKEIARRVTSFIMRDVHFDESLLAAPTGKRGRWHMTESQGITVILVNQYFDLDDIADGISKCSAALEVLSLIIPLSHEAINRVYPSNIPESHISPLPSIDSSHRIHNFSIHKCQGANSSRVLTRSLARCLETPHHGSMLPSCASGVKKRRSEYSQLDQIPIHVYLEKRNIRRATQIISLCLKLKKLLIWFNFGRHGVIIKDPKSDMISNFEEVVQLEHEIGLLCDLSVIYLKYTIRPYVDVMKSLAQYCPNLRKLVLHKSSIGDILLERIVKNCQKLSELELEACCELSDVGLEYISNCRRLKRLTLSNRMKQRHNFKRVIQKVFQNCKELEELRLLTRSGCLLSCCDVAGYIDTSYQVFYQNELSNMHSSLLFKRKWI